MIHKQEKNNMQDLYNSTQESYWPSSKEHPIWYLKLKDKQPFKFLKPPSKDMETISKKDQDFNDSTTNSMNKIQQSSFQLSD